MILKSLTVGPIGTNCYILGSDETREAFIIDPGGDHEKIISVVEENELKPVAVLLTHGHFDHTLKVGKISRHFDIPLMFNKKEYDSGIFNNKKADKWLEEGDTIKAGDITLHVLETPGHSPGSLSFYTDDVDEYKGQKIDGIIFTGDLLFRRSIGRSDVKGASQSQLFESIKKKIMEHPKITDGFVVFPGHMGKTSVGEERKHNMFKNYFT